MDSQDIQMRIAAGAEIRRLKAIDRALAEWDK